MTCHERPCESPRQVVVDVASEQRGQALEVAGHRATVMATLPRTCPASSCRTASGASSSEKVGSMLGTIGARPGAPKFIAGWIGVALFAAAVLLVNRDP